MTPDPIDPDQTDLFAALAEAEEEAARARTTDPGTSHAAAASVKVRQSQVLVLGLLSLGPATDETLVRRAEVRGLAISPSGVRSRRAELVRLGMVEDSGIKVPLQSGRQAIVWQTLA